MDFIRQAEDLYAAMKAITVREREDGSIEFALPHTNNDGTTVNLEVAAIRKSKLGDSRWYLGGCQYPRLSDPPSGLRQYAVLLWLIAEKLEDKNRE